MELKSIMTKDWKHCFLCGKPKHQIHHVMGGSRPIKKKSEKYGLLVPLCYSCHGKVHDTASDFYYLLKSLAQEAFEKIYSRALWMKEFGKNYL